MPGMDLFGRKKSRAESDSDDTVLPGLGLTAELISVNAAESVRDGRWADAVADLAEANRRAQRSLHEAVEQALAHGETFESLANASHLSPEYLAAAYKSFDRGMWAQPGPDKDGREFWRVLG